MTTRAGGQLWVAIASFLTRLPAIPQHLCPHPQGWQKQHHTHISDCHQLNDEHVNGREEGRGQKGEAFVSLWLRLCVWRYTMKVACSITRPWFSWLLGNSQRWWGQHKASVREGDLVWGNRGGKAVRVEFIRWWRAENWMKRARESLKEVAMRGVVPELIDMFEFWQEEPVCG